MPHESDIEIGGRLRAQRLRAASPPKTRTIAEGVRVERQERRNRLEGVLAAGETYEDVEIENGLRGTVAVAETDQPTEDRERDE